MVNEVRTVRKDSAAARRARPRGARDFPCAGPAPARHYRRAHLSTTRRITAATLIAIALALGFATPSIDAAPAPAVACERLASLALPSAHITTAQAVAAGALSLSGADAAGGPQTLYKQLGPLCRVAAARTPSSDSDIKIEVWMPAANWNGKFQAVGNGAFSGSIGYAAMAAALGRGYATASTDTGHTGNTAAFALGHPEKTIDFGWRAVHEMTVAAKTIIAAYYETAPKFSYFNGCSAGGRQGMKEAQRFPADFDGIIAGSPGLDWTGRAAQAVRVAQALQKDEGARVPAAGAQLVHAAVLDACDAADGVRDGIVNNPKQCAFDPGVLQCKGAATASCLTPSQVSTVRLLYSPLMNTQTKRAIAGLAPGSELGWTEMGWSASARATGLDQFRFLTFRDPQWDIDRFNAATDPARAEEADNDTINALDPDLKPFIARGGKLIQYHGWSDPQISPENSTSYYQRVVDVVGAAVVPRAYRLFMAPGMAHCGGGDGPNTFDMVGALEAWVEHGNAPDQILASHSKNGSVDRTRPLCPYPQVATYKGTGSIDEAASFQCKAPSL
jgi:feruloyl esterase